VRLQRPMVLALLAGLAAVAVPLGFAASESQPATQKTQTRPAKQGSKTAPQTQTAPTMVNQPVQSSGGVTVRENYFMQLPGIDLSTLTPKQKQRYLDRVNKELCNCGCPNETIAWCLVNDPGCPAVRGTAEKVLSEVKSGK
jgi:hypothetical protein